MSSSESATGSDRTWPGWTSLLEGEARAWLETEVLPPFVARQRWYGGRTRAARSMRVADAMPLLAERAVLTLVEVAYADGTTDTYVVPLALGPHGDGAAPPDGAVLAWFHGDSPARLLYDGAFDPELRRDLFDIIHDERSATTWHGRVTGHAGALLPDLAGPDPATLEGRLSAAEQSNTSIRYGDRLMLKLFRRPSEGCNPERELTEFLTDRVRFDAIARFGGSVDYRRPGRDDTTIALLQAFVPNQGDAWALTLEALRGFFARELQASPPPPGLEAGLLVQWLSGHVPDHARHAVGDYLDAAATLARRTAQLHVALASVRDDEAFAPQLAGPAELSSLAEAMHAHCTRAFDALAALRDRVPRDAAPLARQVLARRDDTLEVLDEVRHVRQPVPITRIHGDYHLGQVLVTRGDFVIVDFEGEPARSLPERRERHSPLKDVAGMLRSFGYAAEAGRIAAYGADASSGAGADRARLWEAATGTVFLSTYLDAAAAGGVLPADPQVVATILEAYLLDKVVYELRYELDNRPAWVGIPLRGLLALGRPR